MTKTENSMFKKLLDSVELAHLSDMPWSASLKQIQKVYGVKVGFHIVKIAEVLRSKSDAVVYLCLDLPDADELTTEFDTSHCAIPSLNSLILYSVPPRLLWESDGELYRKLASRVKIADQEFSLIYVCYRNAESVSNNLPYTRFIELHLETSKQ